MRAVLLRNRIVVSPMCQYSSTHGFANTGIWFISAAALLAGGGTRFTEANFCAPPYLAAQRQFSPPSKDQRTAAVRTGVSMNRVGISQGSGGAAVVELAEQVLDFLRPHLRFGVIERHRAMQSTLRCLEPLACLL